MTPTPPSYALTVALHPDGWRLHTLHDGKPQDPICLRVVDVEQIGRVMSDAVPTEGHGEGEVTPYELVRTATAGLKAKIDTDLQEAEETARTIPALRKAREEIDNIQ